MKIVYFIDHLRPDGTQYVLIQLLEGLSRRGHQQHVFCLNDSWDDEILAKARKTGASVKIIGKLPLFFGVGLYSTYETLVKKRFDVALTMLFASDVIGRLLSHYAEVPRIVTSIQTHDNYYKNWQRWMVRQTAQYADSVILNSEFVRTFAIKEEGAAPERIIVIPNSIETKRYQITVDRQSFLNSINLPTDAIVGGIVGRLIPQKGHDILFKALAEDPHSRLHVLIAGTGDEESLLRDQAKQLGIDQRVHFLGFRRDIPFLMNCFDLYIQPSRYEGMPIAVLEAMAAGCPVIASAVDGNRELIIDGESGWLVPAEDPHALANAIQHAVNDLAQAKSRGERGRQRAETFFNIDKVITLWENVLADRQGTHE